MTQLKEFLKKTMPFQDLSDEEISQFLTIMNKRKYSDKKMIFLHDTPITHVYFVASGNVKIYRNDLAGKEQIISVKQPGDMFPHVGFFRQGNYPANAQAIEDTYLYSIAISDFEEVLLENPHLTIKLFRVLGDQIVQQQHRLEEMALRTTNERILLLLLRLSESHGGAKKEGWIKLNTRFTNSDLANMIGTTRESVNRMISQLRKEKAIKLEDSHFLIFPDLLKSKLFT